MWELTAKLPYPGVQNLKGSSWIASSAPLALAHITELPKYCFSRELDTEQSKGGVSCMMWWHRAQLHKVQHKGRIAAKASLSLCQNPPKRELQVPLLLGGQASVLKVRFLSEAALLAARWSPRWAWNAAGGYLHQHCQDCGIFFMETIKLRASLSMEIAFLTREGGWRHSFAVESWGVRRKTWSLLLCHAGHWWQPSLAMPFYPSSKSACWLCCPCNLRFVWPAGNHQSVCSK